MSTATAGKTESPTDLHRADLDPSRPGRIPTRKDQLLSKGKWQDWQDGATMKTSDPTAEEVIGNGANTVKHMTMERGKSPDITFASANPNAARQAAFSGIFGNQGEVCVAGARVIVQLPTGKASIGEMQG
jgi:acyl-CoA reductase-like NAD-dependent aldehyde dehydrogenase